MSCQLQINIALYKRFELFLDMASLDPAMERRLPRSSQWHPLIIISRSKGRPSQWGMATHWSSSPRLGIEKPWKTTLRFKRLSRVGTYSLFWKVHHFKDLMKYVLMDESKVSKQSITARCRLLPCNSSHSHSLIFHVSLSHTWLPINLCSSCSPVPAESLSFFQI